MPLLESAASCDRSHALAALCIALFQHNVAKELLLTGRRALCIALFQHNVGAVADRERRALCIALFQLSVAKVGLLTGREEHCALPSSSTTLLRSGCWQGEKSTVHCPLPAQRC
jgi:hypothetical protein